MHYRKLGRTGIEVSEIGFGAWGIGGEWGGTDDDEAERALRCAYDLGVTEFDTALGYGGGHSEQLIGKVLGPVRDRIRITTKIPPKTWKWPALPTQPVRDVYPRDWIIECTEKSLKNLGTDHLDVQQLHEWTDPWVEQTEWLEALALLKSQGKILAFGVSANDWDPYQTVRLVESDLIDTVQVIYNIFEQRPAEKLLPAALKHNVGIIVRVPFEEGLLTGAFGPAHKFGDWRDQWLGPDRLVEASQRVDRLRAFLNEDHPTLPSLALQFVLSHPAVSTVIPGMRKLKNVEANLRCAGKRLTEAELAALKAHAFAHGWKYPWSQD
jgi:aryl-alcohol dehydrogenase-like predicted oxidoreductase